MSRTPCLQRPGLCLCVHWKIVVTLFLNKKGCFIRTISGKGYLQILRLISGVCASRPNDQVVIFSPPNSFVRVVTSKSYESVLGLLESRWITLPPIPLHVFLEVTEWFPVFALVCVLVSHAYFHKPKSCLEEQDVRWTSLRSETGLKTWGLCEVTFRSYGSLTSCII